MKRPSQHLTGELGEMQVAQRLVEHGWIVTKLHSDYGFDFLIQRVEGEIVTSDFALIQVKAVQARVRKAKQSYQRTCRIFSKHLRLWYSCPLPCFLALVSAGKIYILDSKAVIRDLRFHENDDGVKERSFSISFPQGTELGSPQIDQMKKSVEEYWADFRNTMLAAEVSVGVLGGAVAGAVVGSSIPLLGSLIGAVAQKLERKRNKLLSFNEQLRPLVGEELATKITSDLLRILP
jgi:hypothetical protein